MSLNVHEFKTIEEAKRIIEAWRYEMRNGNPCGTMEIDLTAHLEIWLQVSTLNKVREMS